MNPLDLLLRPGRYVPSWSVVGRDTAIVLGVCTLVALGTNLLRSDGIPLIQREEYQILVPCPETAGEAPPVAPQRELLEDPRVLLIDARPRGAYDAWHLPRARSVPFDYLEATPRAVIRELASSGAREVLVYGDGQDPDSGEQLARELSGKGIRNIRFVTGGAPAMQRLGQPGGAP